VFVIKQINRKGLAVTWHLYNIITIFDKINNLAITFVMNEQ